VEAKVSWRYRVVRKDVPDLYSSGNVEEIFTIHEHYTGDIYGEKGIITVRPMHPQGESVEELRRDIELMLKAFDHPVLEDEDFNEPSCKQNS
jgi:hypothetical protein